MGIVFEYLAATVCSVHYMFHDFDTIRKVYIFGFLIIGFCTVIISAMDMFISAKFNIFLMLLYASLFSISFISSIHWVAIADYNEVTQMTGYVLGGFLFLFIGFIFFWAKFPECYVQNKYIDYFLQSHTIWHVFCAGSIICYYSMLYHYNILVMAKSPKI